MEQKENLTFGQALEALKAGKKVTRAIWGGYWFYARPEYYNGENTLQQGEIVAMGKTKMEPMIIAVLKTGESVPAQPYQIDMLSEDWMIVE